MMYRQNNLQRTKIKQNTAYEGETIEKKIRRIVNNKEPISDGAPLIFTERKQGVQPAYNIRTDRWEVAVEAMDKVAKTHQARREERHKTPDEKLAEEAKKNMQKEGQAGGLEN